jgi:hypothetical protein
MRRILGWRVWWVACMVGVGGFCSRVLDACV